MASAADAPRFDLQSHSTRSDGELSPANVVAAAARAGVEVLALSDHDSVDGIPEAASAAREHGIRLVPATEVSALHEGERDLHILGYLIDHESPALRDLGFNVDESELDVRRARGDSIGRPHLAQAVVRHPDNAPRLRRERLETGSDVLEAYLTPGARAFSPRSGPTVAEAIELIHAAGGVAVWAHPFWDFDTPQEVLDAIDRFKGFGIDGVEAFYVTHTKEQTELAAAKARALDLLTTGSADFHGPSHPHFHAFRAFDLYGLQPVLGPIGE